MAGDAQGLTLRRQSKTRGGESASWGQACRGAYNGGMTGGYDLMEIREATMGAQIDRQAVLGSQIGREP